MITCKKKLIHKHSMTNDISMGYTRISETTGATSGVGVSYLSGEPELTHRFVGFVLLA